nr:immunoglobulin light chain junction region [Macaca mulatta]
YMQPLQTPFTF